MHTRTALGAADVTDGALAAMVADLLGVERAEVTSCEVEPAAYATPSITTVGRWWVRGAAVAEGRNREFSFFVKHVQSWTRSPFFAFVPEEMREMAAASVPWRTEAAVYRSDLAQHLPDGLRMPRALAVHDIDELSQAMWLEPVPVADRTWDLPLYARAAYLLGRLAGSPAVRPYADVGGHEWSADSYIGGRVAGQVLPLLADEAAWHSEARAAFDGTRDRLLRSLAGLEALAAEFRTLPLLTAHGDACPDNLLAQPGQEGFTLIDFGFWNALPVGFDLGQLLVGDVQTGRRAPADLAERDAACVDAYCRGLADEGYDASPTEVRRAHAVQLFLYNGLSSFVGGSGVADDNLAARAALSTFSLDLLEQTA